MDIALQITPTGLSYALKPMQDSGERIVGMYMRWTSSDVHPDRAATTRQEIVTKRAITHVLRNSSAETVLLAVEEGTSRHRAGATRTALSHENCVVTERPPHPDGALGLMREWLGQEIDGDMHESGNGESRYGKSR